MRIRLEFEITAEFELQDNELFATIANPAKQALADMEEIVGKNSWDLDNAEWSWEEV